MGETRSTQTWMKNRTVGKYESKIQLWRGCPRWKYNNKVHLEETVHEAVDWIQVAQDKVQCRAPMHEVIKL